MSRPYRDLDRILEIARLHYEDRLPQAEIATKMEVSPATISRYLQKALALGFVETRVVSSAYRQFAKEAELVRKFGLSNACVVPTMDSYAATEQQLAQSTARVIRDLVARGSIFGVSNGRTVAATVAEMQRGRSADVEVITLIGGVARAESASGTSEICRALAEKLGGQAWMLPVPAVVPNAGIAQAIVASDAAVAVFERMQRLSVAIIGIGGMAPGSSTFQHGLFDPAHLAELIERKAAGSICARFFDADGKMLHSDLDDRTISISLAQLKAVPTRLGIAFGPDKVDAIRASMRGGYVSHLATDSDTANLLLQEKH